MTQSMDCSPVTPVLHYTSQVFAPDGPLARLIPGHAPNAKQAEYAGLVAGMIGSEDPYPGQGAVIALLEAATGTGKSIGYLVPMVINAALTGERAVISTHSNLLSRQLVLDDGPLAIAAVRAVLPDSRVDRVTIAARAGRRNFVDCARVAAVAKALDGAGGKDAAECLRGWLDAAPATFAAAADLGMDLPDRVTEADVCLLPTSSEAASTAFAAHVADGRGADIMVTNHALSLQSARLGHRLIGGDGRPARIGVFDEADTLPGTARSMAEARLPFTVVESLASRMPPGPELKALASALAGLRRIATPLLADSAVVFVEPGGPHAALIAAVERLRAALSPSAWEDGWELAVAMRELREDAADWLRAAGKDGYAVAVLAVSPVRSMPALVTVETRPGAILTRLWRCGRDGPYMRAVLLTSATLAAPSLAARSRPDFNGIKRELCLSGTDNIPETLAAAFAPRQFGKLSFMLARRDAAVPTVRDGDGTVTTDPDWLDYAGHGIMAAHAAGGRTLVLATSYADAEALGERVPGALVQLRGTPLSVMADAFRADPAAILITPAGWAGLNLPGMVDHLVIPRMPFAAPDEARAAVRIRAMARRGMAEGDARGVLAAAARADAMRRMSQGLGRALRRPSDRATVWILDPRFPLPDNLIRANPRLRLNQGPADRHIGWMSCIPIRFRTGLGNAFERAAIFGGLPVPAKAAA